jgi:type II secretory pathway component PulJ
MSPRRRQTGLSYTELLVATALIALLLVPALEALNTGLQGGAVQQTLGEERYLLQAKLDDVLALPISTLDAAAQAAGGATIASSLSDTVTLSDGGSRSRQVYLSRYDGDNADADANPFTGTDTGLIWVRVAITGTTLAAETLTAQ